ncbi:hypothetical protein [Haliscomenobacter sp.]|uniref:hypothetical protein n=1 Tax=Haliscomenobacter sp. TaxID=2717303 RepID=UPI003593B348
MKKVLFLLGLFTLCATVTFAQERTRAKAKTAKPSGWRDDSLLWVKKPVGNATIKSPRDAASGQTGGQPKQDKLGNFEIQDVKAPENNTREAGSGQATGRRVHKPVRRKPN